MSVFEPSNAVYKLTSSVEQTPLKPYADHEELMIGAQTGWLSGARRWPYHDVPFLYEPNHENFLLGHTNRLGGQYDRYVWAGLLLVLGLALSIFAIFVIPSWQADTALQREGIATPGTILDRWISKSPDGEYYYVLYEFQVDGIDTYTEDQAVSYASYQTWEPGSTVTVTYVPGDPAISELRADATATTNRRKAWAMSFGCSVAPMLLLIAFFAVRRRERRMINRGHILRGEIVSYASHEDAAADLTIKLHYRFVTTEGKEIVTTKQAVANSLKNSLAPHPGRAVAVLYMNEKMHRLL
ncbi:MAG: DUF3592 domain-containing protein [Anaerolineae bacterium]|nr:DUF3592 domain-containing protein [Anaerolineae bacterium]